MLGSHFDLAQEIKTIAAKRIGTDAPRPKSPPTDPAFDDFDRRMSAFLATVSPILVDSSMRSDFDAPRSLIERD